MISSSLRSVIGVSTQTPFLFAPGCGRTLFQPELLAQLGWNHHLSLGTDDCAVGSHCAVILLPRKTDNKCLTLPIPTKRLPLRLFSQPSTNHPSGVYNRRSSTKMRTGSIRQDGGALEDIVSLTPVGEPRHKITVATLREKKLHHQPITCLTAYDYASARLVDEASADMVLVGDTLAMTILGHPDTLSVTVDEMLHHTRAARRWRETRVVCGRYAIWLLSAPVRTMRCETRSASCKEGGAEVVKMEGGEKRADLIPPPPDRRRRFLWLATSGLLPQSVNVMGGYKVQGKSLAGVEQLMRDAVALDRAGIAFLVLEGIPREVAAMISCGSFSSDDRELGAGPDCRWPSARVPRYSESHLCSASQVRSPLRGCGRAHHRCRPRLPRRRGLASVSSGSRVLPSVKGNPAGAGNGSRTQTRNASIGRCDTRVCAFFVFEPGAAGFLFQAAKAKTPEATPGGSHQTDSACRSAKSMSA